VTDHQPGPTNPLGITLRRASKRIFNAEAATAYLFILPSLIGFVAFYGYPAVRAVLISFTEWNLLRAPRPIGLGNYERLLSDPLFWNAMKVTGLYVLYNIPFQTVLGLFMAVAMHRLTQSLAIRGVLVLPYLVSNVVVGLAFLWVLDPLLGTMNMVLGWFGIDRQPFLGSPDQALLSIAGINIWRHMGFVALLFYAGLQAIPKELYEAGTIDGAGEGRLFRYISLPLLRPVMVFVLVTSVIGSFQIFDTIAVTTQGGPVNATRAIVWYIYENAFQFFRMGYASALSVVLFLLLITVTILQMRLLQGNRSEME